MFVPSLGATSAAACMAALALATIGGNGGVLSALARARRAPQHYPLASLAAADLLVGAAVLPIAAARELFVFRLSWWICACWSTLDVLCCTASILSLCVLGWERWSGITDPLGRARRAKRARILAALVWPVATAVAVPAAIVKSPELREDAAEKACAVNTNAGYVFFSVTLSFYVPTCVMVVLYGQILQALAAAPSIRCHRGQAPECDQNQSQGISEDPEKPPQQIDVAAESRQRRATITIVRLMSLFLICWTPFFIMLPIDSLCECISEFTWQWCTWLGYANSALNPVVYAAAAPRVTRAIGEVFRMKKDIVRKPTSICEVIQKMCVKSPIRIGPAWALYLVMRGGLCPAVERK